MKICFGVAVLVFMWLRMPFFKWHMYVYNVCIGRPRFSSYWCGLQYPYFGWTSQAPTNFCPSHVSRGIHTKYYKIPKGAFSHVDGGKRIQKPLQTDPTRLERWMLPNFWQIRKSSLKQISTQCHLAAGVTQPCGLFQVFILPIKVYCSGFIQ